MSSPADLLTSRFGDGLAVDPDLAAAAESAVIQALAPLRGQRPDLLCVFICGDDPAAVEAAATRAMTVAGARTTLGCSAGGVIGAGRGMEAVPAVSAFAACLGSGSHHSSSSWRVPPTALPLPECRIGATTTPSR